MVAELIHTFEATIRFIEQSVADLSDQQMIQQPKGLPNHAAWTLGHIIFSCQGMAIELGVKPWLPDDWESHFGYGSTPHADLRLYPAKAELLSLLADSAERLVSTIRVLNPSDLQQSLVDEDLPTMSHLLWQVAVAHTAYHTGQLAVWRRAIGKKSTGVYV